MTHDINSTDEEYQAGHDQTLTNAEPGQNQIPFCSFGFYARVILDQAVKNCSSA